MQRVLSTPRHRSITHLFPFSGGDSNLYPLSRKAVFLTMRIPIGSLLLLELLFLSTSIYTYLNLRVIINSTLWANIEATDIWSMSINIISSSLLFQFKFSISLQSNEYINYNIINHYLLMYAHSNHFIFSNVSYTTRFNSKMPSEF